MSDVHNTETKKSHLVRQLVERLRYNAEFRREKQVEFPGDTRNADAVQESERLADELANGRYSDEPARSYVAFCQDDRTSYYTAEAESELIVGIGFGQHFIDADDLLKGIVDRAKGPHSDGVDFIEEGSAA